MFIRDSSKLLRVLGAVFVVMLLYVALDIPLRRLAIWAETSADSYPWGDEDYLRYLLPTLFENRGEHRILITGPSEAREDLLYEQFDSAFPGRSTYQGGIGGGALRDLLIGLDYLALEYGAGALPDAVVLGITPRFIANIPLSPAPVVESISRYSVHWKAKDSSAGPVLEPKGGLHGLVSRLTFQFKQHARYKAAVCTAALHIMNGGMNAKLPRRNPEGSDGRWRERLRAELEWQLYFCRAPNRFHRFGETGTEDQAKRWLTSPHSFWPQVHAWDAYDERDTVEAQLRRLVRFMNEHDIALYVVNLPEHPENQQQYYPGYNKRYLDVVRSALGDVPFLDLRTLLRSDQYLDHAHADLSGARLVTTRTIQFIDGVEKARRHSPDVIVRRATDESLLPLDG